MTYDQRGQDSTVSAPVSTTRNVTASSGSSGSPFGRTPSLTPEQATQISGLVGNLTYSTTAGGYLFNDESQNANSWYNKFGAGGGGNPAANRRAEQAYAIMGSAPTVPGMTSALQSLYAAGGGSPRLGPSYNDTLASM